MHCGKASGDICDSNSEYNSECSSFHCLKAGICAPQMSGPHESEGSVYGMIYMGIFFIIIFIILIIIVVSICFCYKKFFSPKYNNIK